MTEGYRGIDRSLWPGCPRAWAAEHYFPGNSKRCLCGFTEEQCLHDIRKTLEAFTDGAGI